VLDLVATGFDKPASVYGHCMRSEADVQAAAAAFQAAAQLRRPDSITSNSSACGCSCCVCGWVGGGWPGGGGRLP
jgi:hypothetical protein